MGEGNHLPTTNPVGRPKGRLTWLVSGAAVAVVTCGLLMQYVRSSTTKAASDSPAGTSRVASTAKKPEILAKVGDEPITYDAVAEEAVKRFGREVLEDLINRLMVQQACEKHKITVSEQEITDEISRIAKKFNLDVSQWLQMLQAERNISPTQYRQSVIFPLIAMKKLAGEEVDITEQDLKEAFVRNYGPRVKARMILFDNQRRAQECWDKVDQNPDDFEQLAAKQSIDPSSRALGGQIPPIAKYNGNPTLEKAAFSMKKPGEISGVIEVEPSRFVILKFEGRTEPVVTNMEQVKDTLYDELKETKIQGAVAKMFESIKKETPVDNYLTQTMNRPEKTAGSANPAANVTPVSGTKPVATRPAKTAGAAQKESRN